MTINIKKKVLIGFGTLEMICAELKANFFYTGTDWRRYKKLIHTLTEHTSIMLPVNITQDYDY